MKLSLHFKVEDFIPYGDLQSLKRIVRNILEPVRQRFGEIELSENWVRYDVIRFRVKGFSNTVIAEYIEQNLIHSDVTCMEDGWIYVACDADA